MMAPSHGLQPNALSKLSHIAGYAIILPGTWWRQSCIESSWSEHLELRIIVTSSNNNLQKTKLSLAHKRVPALLTEGGRSLIRKQE